VADTGAGIDVIVAKSRTDQLLDEIGFLVGAARGCNAANGILAVFGLNTLEPEAA
jgi:hypothetical protein